MQSFTDEEFAAVEDLRGRASSSEIAHKIGVSMSRVEIYYGSRPRTRNLGDAEEASLG